jgi:sulfoxide reductase heme-binding subunit YedZ
MLALAAASPSPFWFLTRGTGAVTLVLLTVTLALGIANIRRARFANLPRFVTDSLHRNAALLAVTFLVVHVVTALLDGFAPITLVDVVIPFGSSYRPLWLGFGAVALDLLVALILTSLLRRRLGYRAWRTIHWLAYLSWPVAILHGFGTGSDARTHWMLALSAGCVLTMVIAALVRIGAGWPEHLGWRVSGLAATAAVPLGLLVWLPQGPLAAGWAKKAGTPSSLLRAAGGGQASRPLTATSQAVSVTTPPTTEQAENEASFSSPVTGTVHQSALPGNQTRVDIVLSVSGQHLNQLRLQIQGPALGGGGVQMSSSSVTLGSASDPTQYTGRVTGLEGGSIEARVANPGYATFALLARLNLPPGGGQASGTLTATSAEGAH